MSDRPKDPVRIASARRHKREECREARRAAEVAAERKRQERAAARQAAATAMMAESAELNSFRHRGGQPCVRRRPAMAMFH